jgi:hypothetical protein
VATTNSEENGRIVAARNAVQNTDTRIKSMLRAISPAS